MSQSPKAEHQQKRDREERSLMELDPESIRTLGYEVADVIADYYRTLDETTVYSAPLPQALNAVFDVPLPEDGTDPHKLLEEFCRDVLPNSMHLASPRYFGLFNPTPTPISVMAEALSSAINQNGAAESHMPAGAHIEKAVIRWLCDRVGFGPQSFGTLVSGGSLANLTAVKMALHRVFPETRSKGLTGLDRQPVMYASQECHYSFDKIADLVGIGTGGLRKVPVDSRFRIKPELLRQAMAEDISHGRQPFCIVGVAGTTNAGAIDDLKTLGALAAEYQVWFHVDAAWGGAVRLSEKYSSLLDGIELADSVTLDPHKWFYVPFLAGAILTRDSESLRNSFNVTPAYVADAAFTENNPINFFQMGIQGSRRFDALKVWMSLRQYGRKVYAQVIDERIALAEYLTERVTLLSDFIAIAPPSLAIFCFRYCPERERTFLAAASASEAAEINARLDRINQKIQFIVERSGRAWISTTVLGGVRALRACITSYLTVREDVDALVALIQDAAKEARSISLTNADAEKSSAKRARRLRIRGGLQEGGEDVRDEDLPRRRSRSS